MTRSGCPLSVCNMLGCGHSIRPNIVDHTHAWPSTTRPWSSVHCCWTMLCNWMDTALWTCDACLVQCSLCLFKHSLIINELPAGLSTTQCKYWPRWSSSSRMLPLECRCSFIMFSFYNANNCHIQCILARIRRWAMAMQFEMDIINYPARTFVWRPPKHEQTKNRNRKTILLWVSL